MPHSVYTTYRIRQNFRVGKLSRSCIKYTIHWKTFAVHQAVAIMYCTQPMIQGENFRDWLKNRENCESFPTRKLHHVYGNIIIGLRNIQYNSLVMLQYHLDID